MNIEVTEPAPVITTAPAQSVEEVQLKEFYTVQIMNVAKNLPAGDPSLKGIKAEAYKPAGSNTYKYIVGRFATREEAQKELLKVKEKFPSAFIIYIK